MAISRTISKTFRTLTKSKSMPFLRKIYVNEDHDSDGSDEDDDDAFITCLKPSIPPPKQLRLDLDFSDTLNLDFQKLDFSNDTRLHGWAENRTSKLFNFDNFDSSDDGFDDIHDFPPPQFSQPPKVTKPALHKKTTSSVSAETIAACLDPSLADTMSRYYNLFEASDVQIRSCDPRSCDPRSRVSSAPSTSDTKTNSFYTASIQDSRKSSCYPNGYTSCNGSPSRRFSSRDSTHPNSRDRPPPEDISSNNSFYSNSRQNLSSSDSFYSSRDPFSPDIPPSPFHTPLLDDRSSSGTFVMSPSSCTTTMSSPSLTSSPLSYYAPFAAKSPTRSYTCYWGESELTPPPPRSRLGSTPSVYSSKTNSVFVKEDYMSALRQSIYVSRNDSSMTFVSSASTSALSQFSPIKEGQWF